MPWRTLSHTNEGLVLAVSRVSVLIVHPLLFSLFLFWLNNTD